MTQVKTVSIPYCNAISYNTFGTSSVYIVTEDYGKVYYEVLKDIGTFGEQVPAALIGACSNFPNGLHLTYLGTISGLPRSTIFG